MEDEEKRAKKPAYEIGQNLDELSVEELEETISILKNEIDRLQSAREEKSSHLSAAEALFSSKS